MAQPYRANVKCLFEAQKYPDRRVYPDGPAEPPYDVAGWTLPMQMGVEYAEAKTRFDARLELLQSATRSHATRSEAASKRAKQPRLALYRSWVPSMDEGWTRWALEQFAFEYKNIWDADMRLGNLKERFDVIILPDQSMQQIINGNRPGSYPDEYTGGITDAGVDNLKSFVEAGGVLVCLDSASELAIKKLDLPVTNVLEGLRRDQFYATGSIFRATIDNTNPIAYGMPAEADLYFVSGSRRGRQGDPDIAPIEERRFEPRSTAAAPTESIAQSRPGRGEDTLVSAFAFDITDPKRARSVAKWVEGNPLRSGWLLGPQYIAGKCALVDVTLGKGRVVLFGFRTQHRGQTWGTFKFLFNSISLVSPK
jgi:hypothetical protein